MWVIHSTLYVAITNCFQLRFSRYVPIINCFDLLSASDLNSILEMGYLRWLQVICLMLDYGLGLHAVLMLRGFSDPFEVLVPWRLNINYVLFITLFIGYA